VNLIPTRKPAGTSQERIGKMGRGPTGGKKDLWEVCGGVGLGTLTDLPELHKQARGLIHPQVKPVIQKDASRNKDPQVGQMKERNPPHTAEEEAGKPLEGAVAGRSPSISRVGLHSNGARGPKKLNIEPFSPGEKAGKVSINSEKQKFFGANRSVRGREAK